MMVKGVDYLVIRDNDGFPVDVVILPSSDFYDMFIKDPIWDE